jgi:hypothetical protein
VTESTTPSAPANSPERITPEAPDLLKYRKVELWGFEPQTSCMPWEMQQFIFRWMPVKDGL